MQFAVGADDFITYLTARSLGLQHHRLPLRHFFTVFPFRPHTLFTRHTSPSGHLSYWYRPHTSRTRLPLLFIHGIGAGMRTYTGFLRDFLRSDPASADGQQTGVLALELMPISMRLTRRMPAHDELLSAVLAVLAHHGWGQRGAFVTLAHSYGTIVATHLLRHLARKGCPVGPVLLADPVALSIHWGAIPHNFLYRAPRKASEWQLQYFAAAEMCVAHALTRRFDWAENVLWKGELKGIGRATVALAGEDIIVETRAVREYLCDDGDGGGARLVRAGEERMTRPQGDEGRVGKGGLDVLWFEGINHSEMFERARHWRLLVAILHDYCRVSEEIPPRV